MSQKWNLQDIRPAEKRKRRPEPKERKQPSFSSSTHNNEKEPQEIKKTNTSSEKVNLENENSPRPIKSKEKRKGRFNITKLLLIIVALLAVIFGLSQALAKTTLTVYPEFKEPSVNAEFTAFTERKDGALTYEVMTLEEIGERQVRPTGEEHVETQAKGTIEIIKKTPGSERLIKNTRFRTPEGLVYRIQESVVVPGATEDAEGQLVPGTIKADVFADDVGQEYNLSKGTKFDVPGFKESNLNELYNAIHAESAEDFTGGFNGPKYIINDEELAQKQQELQTELRAKLMERIGSERPAGFVTFSEAVAVTFVDLPTVESGNDMVTIKQKALLQLPLFKESEFANFIAKETITTYDGDPVRITNVDDLNFAYTSATTSASNIESIESLRFSLVGKPQVVWEYNVEQLKKDLAGKPKTAITTVLTGQKGIATANVSGKPFWMRSFPDDPEDIEVIEVIGVPNEDQ